MPAIIVTKGEDAYLDFLESILKCGDDKNSSLSVKYTVALLFPGKTDADAQTRREILEKTFKNHTDPVLLEKQITFINSLDDIAKPSFQAKDAGEKYNTSSVKDIGELAMHLLCLHDFRHINTNRPGLVKFNPQAPPIASPNYTKFAQETLNKVPHIGSSKSAKWHNDNLARLFFIKCSPIARVIMTQQKVVEELGLTLKSVSDNLDHFTAPFPDPATQKNALAELSNFLRTMSLKRETAWKCEQTRNSAHNPFAHMSFDDLRTALTQKLTHLKQLSASLNTHSYRQAQYADSDVKMHENIAAFANNKDLNLHAMKHETLATRLGDALLTAEIYEQHQLTLAERNAALREEAQSLNNAHSEALKAVTQWQRLNNAKKTDKSLEKAVRLVRVEGQPPNKLPAIIAEMQDRINLLREFT